jgi:hypothetical protein
MTAAPRVRDSTRPSGAGGRDILICARPRSHDYMRTSAKDTHPYAGCPPRLRGKFARNSGDLGCLSRLGTYKIRSRQTIPTLRTPSCVCGRHLVRSRTLDRAIEYRLACDHGRNVVRSRTSKNGKLLDSRESFDRQVGLTSLTQNNISNAAYRRGSLKFDWKRRKKKTTAQDRAGG